MEKYLIEKYRKAEKLERQAEKLRNEINLLIGSLSQKEMDDYFKATTKADQGCCETCGMNKENCI